MRTQVIDKVKALAPTGFKIASELPFEETGTELYSKNPKTIYIDNAVTEDVPIVQTLQGVTISNTTTSVTIFFTTDAKNVPASYETLVNNLRGLKDTIEHTGANARESFVRTSYIGDLLLTEVEYRLTRIN